MAPYNFIIKALHLEHVLNFHTLS